MKIALVCIAKEEDYYIDEWIKYHNKLGFDNIVVYQNDWDYQLNYENVIVEKISGKQVQAAAYQHFSQKYIHSFDWAAYIDVDEFIVLKKHNTVQDFIKDYEQYPSVAMNWYLFGDNGHESVDGNYNVVSRFTKRQDDVNQHVKVFAKLAPNVSVIVHHANVPWVDTNHNWGFGPFNINGPTDIVQLNHYFCKTRGEFEIKCAKGRADDGTNRSMSEFDGHNRNDVEDLHAYNFINN